MLIKYANFLVQSYQHSSFQENIFEQFLTQTNWSKE
jgi:hypothetical protein